MPLNDTDFGSKLKTMKKARNNSAKKRRAIKNPVSRVDEHLYPFQRLVSLPDAPGVRAVMERASVPYKKRPLSEDEALNLICDARKHEPVHPISKLLRKYKHELGD